MQTRRNLCGSAALAFASFACAASSPSLRIQTPFVDATPVAIGDGEAGSIERRLAVDQPGEIVRATIEAVVSHARPDDLTLTLISPRGTRVPLEARLAEGRSLFRYAQPLIPLQGEPAAGTWVLTAVDRTPGVQGTLQIWGVEFERTNAPPP